MATVEQLKEEIASADAEVARLTPAYAQAKDAAKTAQAAVDAFYARPGKISVSELAKAKKAVETNPNDPAAQSALQSVQSKWDAQQSEFLPLLRARDEAAAAQVEANKPIVAAEERAAQADMAIAAIDPSQASPDAVAALKEKQQGTTPTAPVEDPAAQTLKETAAKEAAISTQAPTVVKTDVEDGVTTEYLSDGTTRVISTTGEVTNYDSNFNPVKQEESPTNPSTTDAATTAQYQSAGVQTFDDGSSIQTFDDGSTLVTDSDGNVSSTDTDGNKSLPKNGVSTRSIQPAAQAEWPDAKDVRAILKVPASYLTNITDPGRILKSFGGIVFPYTPAISFSHDATYTAVNPTHSNYTQYFYKNSAASAISVNAKFTVQNEDDAIILIGVITLLRALTKMKFGPDHDAGAPPPVCRFSAYGNFMLSNVPVTVASFKHDLPDAVDYFQTGLKYKSLGLNFVPVMSTISLTLNPTYSRSEMMRAGVANAVAGKTQRSGFL
jgi:hypothetical protein